MAAPYDTAQPERSAIDATPGLVALDFGANWCGYCRAAEPAIDQALADYPSARHIRVEDGPGRQEVARVVRPESADEVRMALAQAGSA